MSRDQNSGHDVFPQVVIADGTVPFFRPGSLVLVTLHSPREKFWGSLHALVPHGIIFCGITLDSYDDFTSQLRDGDGPRAPVLFFPMHRVERVELDRRSGDVPSTSERFFARTSLSAEKVFSPEGED